MHRLLSALFLSILAGSSGCLDPVHQAAVDALGGEVSGIPRGPMHRAGQTCTTCHADEGPGSPPFAFGGTVYDKRNSTIALPGVTVSMVDAKGVAVSRTSNEVGNFYVLRSEFDPTYPVHVTMSFGAESKEMKTRIGGDGGCARCHQLGGDLTHMPAVYLREE